MSYFEDIDDVKTVGKSIRVQMETSSNKILSDLTELDELRKLRDNVFNLYIKLTKRVINKELEIKREKIILQVEADGYAIVSIGNKMDFSQYNVRVIDGNCKLSKHLGITNPSKLIWKNEYINLEAMDSGLFQK